MIWQRIKIGIKLFIILTLVLCLHFLHKSRRKVNTSSGEQHETSPRQDIPAKCPRSFEITDADRAWFEATFEQVSPFNEHPNETNTKTQYPNLVIMTPVSNVKNKLKTYFRLVCSLAYPHDKMSIVLGEDSSHDQTLDEASSLASQLRPYFRRIDVFRLVGRQSSLATDKHALSFQFLRRKHLAMSRNQILSRGLKDEEWVLWLDSDVRHIPVDLIQHLMSPDKDVVAANCLYRTDDGGTDTFDRNTWQETPASLRQLMDKPQNFLMLEGYGSSERKFLNDLKTRRTKQTADANATAATVATAMTGSSVPVEADQNGSVVPLDGVGGCALLVRAQLHARGLNFPPFLFDHHIETEGFAKMAARVYGSRPYGLPMVHVIHW